MPARPYMERLSVLSRLIFLQPGRCSKAPQWRASRLRCRASAFSRNAALGVVWIAWRVFRANGSAIASFSVNVFRAHCSLRHFQRPERPTRVYLMTLDDGA
jgi:hypothetical protein